MLIDVLGADERFGPPSREALRRCRAQGSLIACDVVWAEVVAGFPEPAAAEEVLSRLGLRFSALDVTAVTGAGLAWAAYRAQGGGRERLIPDFLIGAHARSQAELLLTRDRGFYGKYFPDLRLVDPAAHN